MKRTVIALLVLLLASGFAFGIDEYISVSGTTTLTWGFEGQLTDNTGTALEADAVNATDWTTAEYDDTLSFFDIFGSADDSDAPDDPTELSSSISVMNAEGLTIFKATTGKVDRPDDLGFDYLPGFGFDSIEFPNLVPNMIALKLVDGGFSVTATPLPANGAMDASVTAGLDLAPVQIYSTDAAFIDSTTSLGAVDWWVSGLEYDFAVSFDASFGMDLSKDDSISVSLGTEYDTSWGKTWDTATDGAITSATYVDATAVDSSTAVPNYEEGELYGWTTFPFDVSASVTIADITLDASAEAKLVEGYDNLNKDADGENRQYELPLYADVAVSYEMILGDEVAAAEYAAAEGALVDAKQAVFAAEQAVAKAEAAVEYANSTQGMFDWEQFVEDFTEAFAAHQAAVAVEPASAQVTTEAKAVTGLNDDYGMDKTAMAAVITAAIEAGEPDKAVLMDNLESAVATAEESLATAEDTLSAAMDAAADYSDPKNITITPSAGFKYSSDFWKWGIDSNADEPVTPWDPFTLDDDGDGETVAYFGDVSAADFIGRPMSADLGVNVSGIAGLVSVDLSGGIGFGDGEYAHGSLVDNNAYANQFGVTGLSFVDADGVNVAGQAVTLADIIAGNAELADGDTASDDANNRFFSDSALAYDASLGLTVSDLVDGLTIGNTTTYTVDGLMLNTIDIGVTDPLGPEYVGVGALVWSNTKLSNSTDVDYEVMVGEALAFTIFGDLTYTKYAFSEEVGTVVENNALADAESTSYSTFDYSAGIMAKVSW